MTRGTGRRASVALAVVVGVLAGCSSPATYDVRNESGETVSYEFVGRSAGSGPVPLGSGRLRDGEGRTVGPMPGGVGRTVELRVARRADELRTADRQRMPGGDATIVFRRGDVESWSGVGVEITPGRASAEAEPAGAGSSDG